VLVGVPVQGVVVQLKASSSEKRHAEWESKRVFFCTPQVGCGYVFKSYWDLSICCVVAK
jgi:ERCC4-related helicase